MPLARHHPDDALPRPRRGGVWTRLAVVMALGALLTGLVGASAGADPSADFSIDPDSPTRGEPVTFTAAAACDGTVVCSWSGPAGRAAIGQSVTWTFTEPGPKEVSLTVDDSTEGSGDPTLLTRVVEVANAAPSASFTARVSGRTVAFTSSVSDPEDDAVTYDWDFGDGNGSAEANPEHAYATPGEYTVVLTVTDAYGAASTPFSERVTTENGRPVARLSFSPQRPQPNETVLLDSSSSSDPDGDALTRSWVIDGVPLTRGDEKVLHSFPTAGRHSVSLTVSDPSGAVSGVDQVIEVVNALPTASITASSADPLTDEPVSFTVTSADPDGGPLVYAWDTDDDDEFDDGDGDRVEDHRFRRPGPNRVRVRIRDDEDDEVEETFVVNVRNRPPLVDFDWSPKEVSRRETVTFRSKAVDPEGEALAELAWDLDGDGAYDDAFGEVAQDAFRRGGSHEVGLSALDQHGDRSELRLTLVVGNKPPRAAFRVSPERPRVGASLELTSEATDSDGEIVAEEWDLDGDGAFDDATGPTARRLAETAGKLNVALRVTDDEGTADVSRREIDVTGANVVKPRTPRMLSPFPTVRIAGQVSRRGATFSLVSVKAPRRAKVSWTCRGRGCKARGQTLRSGGSRISRLQGTYRSGAVIEIRVTRRNFIGKHTRIRVRAGKAPTRSDRCLYPGRSRPRKCPAT